MSLTNGDLAALLASAAKEAEGHRRKALLRASGAALVWSEEASDVLESGRPLTELEAIGSGIEARLLRWMDDPPKPAPSELQADFMTFAAARAVLSAAPGWADALRGDLQMHSTHSDGKATLAEMADAAAARGYEYVAITDHSKGLPVARGMTEEELAAQGRAVDKLNERLAAGGTDFRMLRSLEMNLDAEGRGDMDPSSLVPLDLVLGSFHSQLRIADDQTARYVSALRNPEIDVLGHPRARRFNARRGLIADWPRVFEVAAQQGTALEINSHPHRQDLNLELLEAARASGATFASGTDSHDPSELRFVAIGLAAAIKGGIPQERILNFKSRAGLLEWARARRA